jgi:hypothetical protein
LSNSEKTAITFSFSNEKEEKVYCNPWGCAIVDSFFPLIKELKSELAADIF